MKNPWYSQSITTTAKDLELSKSALALETALDRKYSNYDYQNDARELCRDEFEQVILTVLNKYVAPGRKILVTGVNNGIEVPLLSQYKVTGLDLGRQALRKLLHEHPKVKAVHGNVERLPFRDKVFDSYIGLRVLTSSNVNLQEALEESVRVSSNLVLYSIPNGYVVEGKLVKGMFATSTSTFDTTKPYEYQQQIKKFLEDKDFLVEIIEIPSEILIVGRRMGKVLSSTKFVVDHSTQVSINLDKIESQFPPRS